MEFTCKYAKPSGEVVKAVLVGQNIDEVRHHLQEQGLLPMDIRPRAWSLPLRPLQSGKHGDLASSTTNQ